MKNLDWKYIGLMIFLGVLAFASFLFKKQAFILFSFLFNHEWLVVVIGIISAIIDITHTIKHKNFSFTHNMSFTQFKNSFEYLFSFIGNPITLVSATILAKGLFLQWTEEKVYFPFFQSLELIFIAMVALYLLIVSSLELKKHFIEIIETPLSSDITPTDNPEQKKE